MSTYALPSRRLPLAIPAAIALAWATALAAEASGAAQAFHHDGLIEGGLPAWAALGLFVASWQVMTAAMMLPSSVPLVRLFWATTRGQAGAPRTLAVFLGGYALVWSIFGLAAFAGDGVLHRLVDSVAALEERPWLVSGAVLVTAGAFQFTRLKEKCLDSCRHPGAYLLQHYRRRRRAAFAMGVGHGVFCLGCCWALMLLMFAAGFANLVWMAALAAVMIYEKVGRHGRTLSPVVGVVLLAWGVLVLAQPAWLPDLLRGV